MINISNSKPLLYIFSISHFCEKARWTFDYHRIDYEIKYLPPGIHMQVAKKLGAPGTSLPILLDNGELIQGSDNIFDWAESKSVNQSNSLAPADMDTCREIEHRLDSIAGVHVRRYYYSESLVEYPKSVRDFYMKDFSFPTKALFYIMWGVIQKRMIEFMDLGRNQRIESRDIVLAELDWMDGLLSDGRDYLVGDKFSRADITAASLLSPITIPSEHPVYEKSNLPPLMLEDIEAWSDRPSTKWVHKIYKEHRIV